jgi:hypothetical protein
VLSILLPVLVTLLDHDQSAGPPSLLHAQAIAQLLGFASASPITFKEATVKLDQTVRDRMEGAVRGALTSRTPANMTAAKPQISLRSF